MKRCKFLTLMFALLLLLQSSVLAANTDTTVTVTLPTFAVTLNDTKIDSAHSEYPPIIYRDITYFPMTYHASRFLHLKSSWYQTEPKGTLFVGYNDASEDTWIDTPAAGRNASTAKATVADYQIAVNTVDKSEFLDNSAEPYPLLNFRGVTYFPLTWRFAVEEFGWDYRFDTKTGLSICSTEQFRPELEDSLLANSAPLCRAGAENIFLQRGQVRIRGRSLFQSLWRNIRLPQKRRGGVNAQGGRSFF